jgi:hypothetical protein
MTGFFLSMPKRGYLRDLFWRFRMSFVIPETPWDFFFPDVLFILIAGFIMGIDT